VKVVHESAAVDFDEVYRTYRERTFRLCRRLTGDPHSAEDAFQEAFLAIHRALPRFRGEAKLSTWIYRIVARTALRARAKRARTCAELTADVPAPTRADADAEEDHDAVRRAIAALPAEHRVVLELFGVEELTSGEIAELLGIPEGTVWSRLHTARKQLARRLATKHHPEN
jgi:RNA polymerase sigma-70 factor (ECF subfamily)